MSPSHVMVLGFASIILLGAIWLTFPVASARGTATPFLNAAFTATSATCVTGLIIYDTATHWSLFGRTVILALIQIGGLVFFVWQDLLEHKLHFLRYRFHTKIVLVASAVLPYVTSAMIGDASNERFLQSLGVANFDLCVVAISDNFESSLVVTSLLKENGAKYVVARSCRDVQEKFLLQSGADEVVYAEKEMVERLAVKYGNENVFDYLRLSQDYSIDEIRVPKQWVGKSIVDLDVRKRCNVNTLAIKSDGIMNTLPDPRHIFRDEDHLMILSHHDDIKPLLK
ncbi:MAG: NAD-binding protein [Bacillota bacterium]|nr:NAD-binding protein [Bacillota bacterium]